MKLTKEVKGEIDNWFAQRSKKEIEYIATNYLNSKEQSISVNGGCKSDSEQLCEHPMSERSDIVGSYITYCLKCSTTL